VQLQVDKAVLNMHPPYRVIVDDGEGLVQAARHGAGLTQVPHYMAAEELGRGNLVEVLPDFRPPPMPVYVVWPGNRLMPARLRVFIDALVAHCAGMSTNSIEPRSRGMPQCDKNGS
jgi:LysR family transcriptional regulator, regulator for bpeEF and oprC